MNINELRLCVFPLSFVNNYLGMMVKTIYPLNSDTMVKGLVSGISLDFTPPEHSGLLCGA